MYICTGYGKEGEQPYLQPYVEEAAQQSIVFLMAVGRLEKLVNNLMYDLHYPSNLGIAIVEKASTPMQRTTKGTLKSIVKIKEEITPPIEAPAIIVVGKCVDVI